MQRRRLTQIDAEVLSGCQPSASALRGPDLERSGSLFNLVPLNRLWRKVPDGAIVQGSEKLDVFSMGPDQRHARAGGMALKSMCSGISGASHTCSGIMPQALVCLDIV